MDIASILASTQNPAPYEKGTAVMWTDPYISKQLLQLHLDCTTDVASRKRENIDAIVGWVLSELGVEHADVLDLGCGPGLYTERFAQNGHRVTGIDFSQNSIEYAKASAASNGLDIQYRCIDYLQLSEEQKYDLALMIYCDFGALNPQERATLIANVYRALIPGGLFIFDAFNEKAASQLRQGKKSWEVSTGGFWRSEPYLCLSESRELPEYKAIMDQHIVVDENGEFEVYRFYNHYFEFGDLERELQAAGFASVKREDGLLCGGGLGNGDDVSFYLFRKKR